LFYNNLGDKYSEKKFSVDIIFLQVCVTVMGSIKFGSRYIPVAKLCRNRW